MRTLSGVLTAFIDIIAALGINKLPGINPLMDARQGRIVELRFFGGLSIEETADVLSLSEATVERSWASARAWLYRQLNRNASS